MQFLPAEYQLKKGDPIKLAASYVTSCGFVVCSLFNYDFISSDYIVLSDWLIANNELERMWKEAVMA
jgi:hypothetical protein